MGAIDFASVERIASFAAPTLASPASPVDPTLDYLCDIAQGVAALTSFKCTRPSSRIDWSSHMPQPKQISPEAIPVALEKALRYRLLNEPLEAESICLDILSVDPDHRAAQTTLLLALTDQFDLNLGVDLDRVKAILHHLSDDFEREYYSGIMYERWGKAQYAKNTPQHAAPWMLQAMRCYDRAAALSASDEPDAILRWNTCARFLDRYGITSEYCSDADRDVDGEYGDDVPPR